MKKEKLLHYANVIAGHADARWVTPLFFFLFFIDSIVLVIPVDSLLGTVISFQPRHAKKWIFFSILGFALGLGAVALLASSQLQPYIFSWIQKIGYQENLETLLHYSRDYGYWGLTLGVFTLVPSLFGVLVGVLLGLNPLAVWAISATGKIIKILLTVWAIFSTSNKLKKYVKIYLKTSV